jgi:transmembrane sensor
MDNKRSHILATKWLDGTITEKEKLEFAKRYNSHDDAHFYTAAEDEAILKDRIFNRILENTKPLEKRGAGRININLRWKLGIAASLLLLLSVIFYRSFHIKDNVLISEHKVPTLTFANGRTIELSGEQKGIIVSGGIKYLNGQAVRWTNKNTANNKIRSSPIEKLRLSTPKGLIYQVTLPDGSKVTLNAGSTLIYPSEFSADERTVELEGEAFFEITKVNRNVIANTTVSKGDGTTSVRVPFRVKSSGQTIEVLGTRFNVSAYKDDHLTQTTLIEGAVSILADHNGMGMKKHPVRLSPGEQALSNENGISVLTVDTEPFTAWKEGYFYFENASVPKVMAQMQHWYDFELYYESNVPDHLFSGKIPRNIPLREALKILNKAGINIHLKADHQVLITSPNKTNN